MVARPDGDRIPIVFTVDLEPDGPGHLVVPGGPSDGIEASRRWVDEIRERAEARCGRPVRVSWLVRCDPQVEELYGSATYYVESASGLFADASARGDDVGLHIHGWRRAASGAWVDDFGDAPWLEECIDRSHAAFSASFGRPCRVASMGNRYLDPVVVARFVHHGIEVDMTGEPARGPVPDGGLPHVRGALPDYRRMPRRPHRLAPGLVELPMTAGRKRLGRNPRAHLSRRRRHGFRERLDQPVQFGSRDLPGVTFGDLMTDALHLARGRPYLSFAVRSDGLLDPKQRPRLLGHLDELLALPEAEWFEWMTPGQALEVLGVD